MKTAELIDLKNRSISSLGGAANVARLLGISTQAISQWREIPIDRAIQIEEKSGGVIHCFEMRPDIFPSCPHLFPLGSPRMTRLTPSHKEEIRR